MQIDRARYILSRARSRGAVDAASGVSLNQLLVTASSNYKIGDIEPSALGFVYFARSDLYPHVLKIGFSKDPAKRIVSVGHLYKAAITLVSTSPGTMFDEMREHSLRWRDRCAHEWFFDPVSNCRDIPPFLLPENVPVQIENRRGHLAMRQGFLSRLHSKTAQQNEVPHDQR